MKNLIGILFGIIIVLLWLSGVGGYITYIIIILFFAFAIYTKIKGKTDSFFAFVLTLAFPGSGHLYIGKYKKGIILVLLMLVSFLIEIVYVIILIYALFDIEKETSIDELSRIFRKKK